MFDGNDYYIFFCVIKPNDVFIVFSYYLLLFYTILFIILLKIYSAKYLAYSNISLPVAVVDAAISLKYILLTAAPIYPYSEFAVILYANYIPSKTALINAFYSYSTFFLYNYLAYNKSIKV